MPSLLDSDRHDKKAKKLFSDFSISTPNSHSSETHPKIFAKYETELAEEDPSSTERLVSRAERDLPRLTKHNLLIMNQYPSGEQTKSRDEHKVKHFGKMAIKLQLLGDTSKSMEWKVTEPEIPKHLLDEEALEAEFEEEGLHESINLKEFEEMER